MSVKFMLKLHLVWNAPYHNNENRILAGKCCTIDSFIILALNTVQFKLITSKK